MRKPKKLGDCKTSMNTRFVAENSIEYILVGECYLPNLILSKERRAIGHWGRLHRDYLKEYHPPSAMTI